MDIVKLIKEAHENAIDKGFYDCPECEKDHPGQIFRYGEYMDCPNCKGSNIDPNKNIGELLMLIVSELGEALEAHRNGRSFSMCNGMAHNPIEYLDCDNWEFHFESKVKDTFEDEIADVFIRLFDLCGYLKIVPTNITGNSGWEFRVPNAGDKLRIISKTILDSHPDYPTEDDFKTSIGYAFLYLEILCKEHNIPIEKHIIAKMAYNKTREHKHGKAY